MTTFTEWLNEELSKRDWSQSDLARKSGIHRGSIYNVINETRSPGAEMCLAIANAFQLPPEYVFVKAGLLPQKTVARNKAENEYLFAKLSDEDQQEILEIMRVKIKLSKK